jgi:tetratricopeptide (TPR) repeat protein
MMALKEERFDEAVAHFESVLEEDPSLMEEASIPYSQALIGYASELMKTDPVKAQASLLRAVELNPLSAKGHSQLGLLYIKQKEYRKAIDAYKKTIELDREGAKPLFNLGYIYMMNEDYENAKEMYSHVVELAPDFLDEALYNLAFVHDKLGQPARSVENLREAIAFNPNNEQAKKYLRRLERRAKR